MPAPSADSILRDGAFRRLVVAEGFAYTAEALLIVLLTLVALDGGATGATAVLVAQGVPRALLLPVGGVLSDRWGAARLAPAAAIARAAVLVAFAALVLTSGTPGVAVLAGVGALLGVVDALAYPASFALVPAVVAPDRLPAANSVIGARTSPQMPTNCGTRVSASASFRCPVRGRAVTTDPKRPASPG